MDILIFGNKSASAFSFSRCGIQAAFTVWVPTAKKIYGVSRGGNPLGSGSSNRGESIPVGIGYPKGNSVALGRGIQRGQRTPWHTIFVGKSSVLYLCGADGSRECSTLLNLCCISSVLVGKVAP